ncbi:unnamed protein product [Boreogadus saida]
MLFFGSAGMSIMCAMAVERYLAISHAYFYSQHIDRSMARLALIAIYLANITLCVMPSFGFGRSLVGMNQRYTRTVKTEASMRSGARRRFPCMPSVTSAAEMQMLWLLILMTIVFLVCSIPFVVRIFVNQLYGPAYISAAGSDLLAIRFASFNPILDPWVYILCRKNMLVKGCARLKWTVGHVKEDRVHSAGWVGQNSPQLFDHSNDTSYASLRTAKVRKPAEDQASDDRGTSFTDFTTRQALDYDTARADYHPFSVEHSAVTSVEGEMAAAMVPKPTVSAPDDRIGGALQAVCSVESLHQCALTRKVDIVTCTFSTPSSTLSVKCI